MTDGYTARPAELNATAQQYDAVSDQLKQIFVLLTHALDREGACWGGDEIGRAFEQKYVPGALSAINQLRGTDQGVRSLVDGICTWARNYVDAEQATASSAGSLSATLDG